MRQAQEGAATKLITAIVGPFKADDIRQALSALGVQELTGFFVSKEIAGVEPGLVQVMTQLTGEGATVVFSATVTFIILIAIDPAFGLRVPEDEERLGLALSLHRERVE